MEKPTPRTFRAYPFRFAVTMVVLMVSLTATLLSIQYSGVLTPDVDAEEEVPPPVVHVLIVLFKLAMVTARAVSAAVALVTSLVRLALRAVRVVISVMRLAVTVAWLTDWTNSAAVARFISAARLAPRAMRVVISLLRFAVTVARFVVRMVVLPLRAARAVI